MERQTFTWGSSGNRIRKTERWVERLWVLGLLLAALLVFGINLGSLPLSDWGEGTVALVAREITKAPFESWRWFYPTLDGKPYLESPPLLYLLIAAAYKIAGVNEWTTRLPGAILSAFSVPILYGIGREIFPARQSAIFSSLIYLTLFPVVCRGRLALSDGMALGFLMLMIWCVLRSRRDLRWALGVGFGFSLIALSKGFVLALSSGAIVFLFLSWDTPRLLTSFYWWLGLLLGSVPGVAWYAFGVLKYGQGFITTGIFNQPLQPIWLSVVANLRHPWYYWVELLKFSIPWLVFFPYGLRLAWKNRIWGWAKLVLVWASVYGLAILVMLTKLSGYILPLYPALALASGALLTEVWHLSSRKSYPPVWKIGLSFLALGTIIGSLYFGIFDPVNRQLSIIFASVGLTIAMAAVLSARRDLQFISILFWGMYISLLLLMTSPYWIGEFQPTYPIKPLADLVRRGTPNDQVIYASFPVARPSLNFYSDRQIIPASISQLKQLWEKEQSVYFLLDKETYQPLSLPSKRLVDQLPGWVLIAKDTN
ncbi:MAG TPA: glycosyltransferase family 39 protein [Candidatus Sericytochromatia bacterium]